jgi:hypothetical protein
LEPMLAKLHALPLTYPLAIVLSLSLSMAGEARADDPKDRIRPDHVIEHVGSLAGDSQLGCTPVCAPTRRLLCNVSAFVGFHSQSTQASPSNSRRPEGVRIASTGHIRSGVEDSLCAVEHN